MSDKLKLVYTVLVLAALVYAERRLIEPRLTGARLSALVQDALVYKVLVYQERHPHSVHSKQCEAATLETTIINSAVGAAGSPLGPFETL